MTVYAVVSITSTPNPIQAAFTDKKKAEDYCISLNKFEDNYRIQTFVVDIEE